jgi:DNA-binding LacI/PurR family transcriptional regulator
MDYLNPERTKMPKVQQIQESLARHIEKRRDDGELRLLPERELAQTFGCSRATIGRVLAIFEGEGSIIRKKGSGTFIAGGTDTPTVNIALVMRNAYQQHDLHFHLIVDEIQKFACENNIYVQIFDRVQDMFRQAPEQNALLKAIRGGVVQGVLIGSRMPLTIISRINELCPTVSINNIFGDGGEIPGVSCDYFRTGFLAARHLLEKNHRKAVYMTDTCQHPESHFYFSGFRAGFEAAGIKLTEQNILETKANIQLFNRRIMEFFKDGSHTACFVRSVSFIPRMLTVLKRNGIRVPEDLSLIAGGNYTDSAPGKLKVTTIDNRLDLMCRTALERLLGIIQGRKSGDSAVTLLEPCIRDRGSCRNPDADLN